MLYAIVGVLILILDQAVKYWTTLHLTVNTGTQAFIPGVVQLTHIHNTGAAFGLMSNARWFFVILTVLFAALIIYLLVTDFISGPFGRWMALLVLAGALGNGLDRAIYGYVVDMFQLVFLPKFPIFNVADIFIDVGAILFCVYILVGGDFGRKKAGAYHAAEISEPAPMPEPEDPFGAVMLRSERTGSTAQPIPSAGSSRPREVQPVTRAHSSQRTAPAASATSASGSRRAPSADEFDLDSILAEFGDKH